MKHFNTFLFLAVLFIVNANGLKAQTANTADSLALVDLYNSTKGNSWITRDAWLTGPVSSWYGITLNAGGRVIGISLANNNLSGTIPASLGNLSYVEAVDLSNNSLNGSMPTELGNMGSAIPADYYQGYIDFSHNLLTGTLPESFKNLNAHYLALPLALNFSYNHLTGAMPSWTTDPVFQPNYINIQHNFYTLSGVENITYYDPVQYYYSGYVVKFIPQDTVLPIHNTNEVLSVAAGGTLANNTYRWYLNNSLQQTITGDSAFTPTTPGNYTVKVSNAKTTGFELTSTTYNLAKPSDSSILVLLYNAANGPKWTNHTGWLTGPLKSWYGVTVNNAGHVTGLSLGANNVKGTIPVWVGKLDSLKQLNLINNKLTFTDLEWVVAKYPFTVYNAQDTLLPLHLNNGVFTVNAGGTPANNTYSWYKNDVFVKRIIGSASFTPWATGRYSVKVNNSIATALSFYSDTASITTLPGYVTDSLALVALYNSTNGAGWTNHTNWLTAAPLSSWYGITIGAGKRVIEIELPGNNLVNTLVPVTDSLDMLTQLLKVDFHNNKLARIKSNFPGSPAALAVNLAYNYLDFWTLDPMLRKHNLGYKPQAGVKLYHYLSPNQDSIIFYTTQTINDNITFDLNYYQGNVLKYGPTVIGGGGLIKVPYVQGDYFMDMIDPVTTAGGAPEDLVLYTDTVHIGVLPIKFAGFTGEKEKQGVVLNWRTATEINSDYFDVLRSADGGRFESVGHVNASGSSEQLTSYNYVDKMEGLAIIPPVLYYRLAGVDKDGQRSYTNIIKITSTEVNNSMLVYPSPTKAVLNVRLTGLTGKVAITITDVMGKTVYASANINATNGIIPVNVASLAAGTYLVTINNNGTKTTKQFIKQ